MIKALVKQTLIILIVALSQVAILANLSKHLKNLDIILVTIIFVSVAYRFYIGVIYALFCGFFVDLYSTLPFGSNMIIYLIVLYCVYIISQKLLTNKSLYSLVALTFISTFFYAFLLYVLRVFLSLSHFKDYSLIKDYSLLATQNVFWQLIFNVGCAVLLFFVFHYSSKQFKAVFIDTTKN